MATIVNTRDVELQATTPRVTQVDMQGNIVIDPNQVDGLGLVLEGTKQVVLQATSQIFQIPKSGAISPASITLTALVKNIVATPTLTIAPGGGTMNIPVTLTSGTFTFAASNMTTDVVTFLLTATEGGTDYTDTMTVVKAREGIDSLNGLLTNESHTLPADYLGNVTNYAGASGRFRVFQGINEVTTACTFSLVAGGNPQNLTYSLTASGASAGNYSVTGGYPVGTDSATLTFRATFGTTTIDKVFTISKAKAGVDGATAKVLRLNTDKQTFTYDGAGNAAPASQTITFTAVQNNLTGSPSFTATGFNASGGSTGSIALSGTGSSRTMTNSQFLANAATVSALVTVTWDGFQDQVTIVKLKDGANNIIGYLTNESVVIATAADGTGGNYAAAGGTFKVFDGLVDKTGAAGPVTYSIPSSSGVVISIAATGVYTVTGTTADTGTATLRAVYNGVTIDKVYSISRSKQGPAGPPGGTGADGERGSRQFYVALSGTNHVWSNTLATSAASEDGGPVLRDVVTEYNNSQNYSETRFWDGTSWLVINAVIDGNLLVDGTIGADKIIANSIDSTKIDSRNLTIKDANGNVVFSANTVAGTDSASTLGFNPLFSNWPSTYPAGWSLWAGAAPTRVTTPVLNSPFSVKYTLSASSNQGIFHDFDFTTEPLPAGTFLTGSVTIRMENYVSGTGKPLYLVRLFKDAGKTTYKDTYVLIPDVTAEGVWQRIPFIAGNDQDPIYSIRFYQMASWNQTGGGVGGNGAAGNIVIFGPFTFDVRQPVSSGTASVFFNDAAVNLAQINTATITNLSALSATIGTLRTAATGGRTEIMDNKIRVYDTTNALRVSIGYLL